jgi:hypothetical protein
MLAEPTHQGRDVVISQTVLDELTHASFVGERRIAGPRPAVDRLCGKRCSCCWILLGARSLGAASALHFSGSCHAMAALPAFVGFMPLDIIVTATQLLLCHNASGQTQ